MSVFLVNTFLFRFIIPLGLSHWNPYGCLELYYCNMVEWSWWDSSLIWKTNWLLQCFDTVGLVKWPVKIVPDMPYNVFGGTLNLAQSISLLCCVQITFVSIYRALATFH